MPRKNISKRLRSARTDHVLFGDVIYEPGSSFGPRMQPDFQLVVLEEGAVSVQVDDSIVRIGQGEVGLLLPGRREDFTFAAEQKSHHTWCSLNPSLLSAELRTACENAPAVLSVSRRLAQLMEMGLSLPRRAEATTPGLIDALGVALLQEYLFSSHRESSPTTDEPDALRRAIEWVGFDGHNAVDLASLAKIAGVSAAQLVKLFKRHLDTTPMRYVWETRTRRGAQLLRETGLTVGEIAFRCGFQTPFHFSRWVKQIHGVAPREFRARAWGQMKRPPA